MALGVVSVIVPDVAEVDVCVRLLTLVVPDVIVPEVAEVDVCVAVVDVPEALPVVTLVV